MFIDRKGEAPAADGYGFAGLQAPPSGGAGQTESFAPVVEALQHWDLSGGPFMAAAGQQGQAVIDHRAGGPAADRGDRLVLADRAGGHGSSRIRYSATSATARRYPGY
jgi:hypothetical protein